MPFDYDTKIADPDYHGGMVNINPKENEETSTDMEGWEKDDE